MTARLVCNGLTGGRGQLVAFRDIELAVEAGRMLTVIGPNGAGKTTFLLTLSGLLPAMSGTVSVDGAELRNGSARAANRAGLVFVPDNRCLFNALSVEDNLRTAWRRGCRAPKDMLSVFPALEARWGVKAGALSGGEQQMLALARAFIQDPKILLIDEMSMGLAPIVLEALFETVRRIADEGCAVVLVEQHVSLALSTADDAAVLSRGNVALQCSAAELLDRHDELEAAYFGAGESPSAGASSITLA